MSLTLPGLALLACLAVFPGQELTLEGVVLAPDGQPAVGARFVASSREGFRDAKTIADSVLGEEGRFRLVVPESWIRRSDFRSLDLWVWREDLSLAQVAYQVEDLPVGELVTIQTRLPRAEEITVRDEAGQPVPGASIAPLSYGYSSLPDVLAEALAIRTDEDGMALAAAWDPGQVGSIAVEAEEHGRQEIGGTEGWFAERELLLAPTGRVRIEVIGEAPPFAPELLLDLRSYGATGDDQRVTRSGVIEVPIPTEPTERIYSVAAGTANPMLSLPGALERVPRVDPGQIEVGELFTMRVEWTPGVRVVGRVVDAESRESVSGVTLSIRNGPLEFPVVSGADGGVEFRALPGYVMITEIDAPPPHVGMSMLFRRPSLNIDTQAEGAELGEIEVTRERTIRGRVVDGAGRPVPGAWVYGSQRQIISRGRGVSVPVAALADEEGVFRIGGALSGEEEVELAARLGLARTRQSAKFPLGTEVELVLAADLLLPLRGAVRDRDGRLVAGATVTIWKGYERFPFQAEEEVVVDGRKQLVTDEEGVLAGGPCLDPAGSYAFVVESPETEPYTSPWITGAELKDGIVLKVPRLVTVRGRLVTAEGTPRAGVTIRVTVDTRDPLVAVTDSAGGFELGGVRPGGAFVLAEIEGVGLRGRWFDGRGSSDWTIVDDEPALRALPRPTSREEELEVAERLAKDWLEIAVESGQEGDILRAMQGYARLDAAGALDRLEDGELDEEWRQAVLREAVAGLAVRDPEEALVVAGEMELGMSSVLARLLVVDALAAEGAERQLEVLGLALAEARRIDTPAYRLVSLSSIAEKLLDLGEEELARELLEDSRSLARDLPVEEWAGYARGSFAEELAVFDLAGALELVDAMPDRSDRTRHYRNIALELASRDPEAAEEVLLKESEPWYLGRAAPGICYHMAPVDLPRARRIADRADSAAEAYGQMARALALEQPEVARELLEVAFARLEDPGGKGRGTYARRSDSVLAGSLLPVAEMVAPDRLRDCLWRAVALRSRSAEEGARPGSRSAALVDDCALSFFIARYDRELARALVLPAVELFRERSDQLFWNRGNWAPVYAALIEIRPEAGAALAEELLPARARGDMAGVLAREGEERTFHVMSRYLNLWTPGDEDLM